MADFDSHWSGVIFMAQPGSTVCEDHYISMYLIGVAGSILGIGTIGVYACLCNGKCCFDAWHNEDRQHCRRAGDLVLFIPTDLCDPQVLHLLSGGHRFVVGAVDPGVIAALLKAGQTINVERMPGEVIFGSPKCKFMITMVINLECSGCSEILRQAELRHH
jgi:hypothetical protein